MKTGPAPRSQLLLPLSVFCVTEDVKWALILHSVCFSGMSLKQTLVTKDRMFRYVSLTSLIVQWICTSHWHLSIWLACYEMNTIFLWLILVSGLLISTYRNICMNSCDEYLTMLKRIWCSCRLHSLSEFIKQENGSNSLLQ